MKYQSTGSVCRCALYVAAIFVLSGCSAGSDMAGKSFTNVDGSERIVFRDGTQVEVIDDGMALQGEYSTEVDNRIRLVVDFLGSQIVGYGTMNDDGGFTLSMDSSAPTRYFSADDPKLVLASREGEIALRAAARFCAEGTCPEFMLSREQDIVLSTVSVSIGDGHKVMFSKVEEVKFADISGRYGSVVRIKGGGSAMFGGWQGLYFSRKSDRDTFYQELVAAVSNWHSIYGVKEFVAADIPGAANQASVGSGKANQPSPKAVTESVQPNDPLVGIWEMERDGHRMEVAFAPDKTLSWTVDDEVTFGTYSTGREGILEFVKFGKYSSKTSELMYRLQDRSLILTDPSRPTMDALNLVKSARQVADSLKQPEQSASKQSTEFHSIEDQVWEGELVGGRAKVAVSEFMQDKGRTPKNNAEAGIDDASRIQAQYVASVEVQNGTIIVTYGLRANSSIAGHSIYLVPDNSNLNSVIWRCYSDPAIILYAPRACNETWTGPQANQTAGRVSTPSVQKRTRSEPATSRQRSRRSRAATSDNSGPVLLFSVPPKYPSRAQSRGIEGTVQVQYSIDANGKTKDVIVIHSTSALFNKAAITSVLERRYEPPKRVITGLKDKVIFKLN